MGAPRGEKKKEKSQKNKGNIAHQGPQGLSGAPLPLLGRSFGEKEKSICWSKIPKLDLANGGSESTRDPDNPVPRTWLYRTSSWRAHLFLTVLTKSSKPKS